MKCPYCACDDDRVFDSRPVNDGAAVRRRRECAKCGGRFVTYEYVERTPLMVIKRDGSRQPYDRSKLIAGVMLACRKRPVSRDAIEALVDRIEARIGEEYRLEIPAPELGEMILEQLKELDPVAYVRFASVYRKFDSPAQFVAELENLEKGGSSARSAS